MLLTDKGLVFGFDYTTTKYVAHATVDYHYLQVDIEFTNITKTDESLRAQANVLMKKLGAKYSFLDFYRTTVTRNGKLLPVGRSVFTVKGTVKLPTNAKVIGDIVKVTPFIGKCN